MINFAVVVVTYNSSKTVLSTLESVLHQTCKPLELIISDDGSTDDTIKICQEWSKRNEGAISRIEVLTVSQNTGVSANCNRGFRAVTDSCDWIKGIAGDDILVPDCLQIYNDYIDENPNAEAVYAAVYSFCDESELKLLKEIPYHEVKTHKHLANKRVEVQREYFNLFGQFTMSPTFCIKREVSNRIPFDERIPMIEDTPFNRNLLYNDVKLHYCPATTVFYRVNDSISHQSSRFVNPIFLESGRLIKKYYPSKNNVSYVSVILDFEKMIERIRVCFFYNICNNTPNRITWNLFLYSKKFLKHWRSSIECRFLKSLN